MRKVRIATLIACIVLLIACGDDSSSAGDVYTYNINASLVVNEADHLLVMIPDSYPVDRCVSEGDALVWKTVVHQAESDSFRYEFHGDSLFLYVIDDEEESSAVILLGGSAGNIYGTWEYFFCRYDREKNEVSCTEKDKQYYEYELEFSENRVTANYEIYNDKILEVENSKDYMESYLMYGLYDKLSSKSSRKRVYTSWISFADSEYVQRAIRDCGVQVIEKTKNGGKFIIGEKTYTLTVNKDDITIFKDEYELYEERNIDFEVSDGITVCKAHYFLSNPVKEKCRAEYAEYMRITNGLDGSGNEYNYAREIVIQNDEEFNKCLEGIAVGESDGSAAPLYKKSTKSRVGIEKFIDRNFLKLLKYAKN